MTAHFKGNLQNDMKWTWDIEKGNANIKQGKENLVYPDYMCTFLLCVQESIIHHADKSGAS